MARDYAKKRAPKSRNRNATRRKKQGFPTAAVLIVGMIVGGFVAFLFYLKFIPRDEAVTTPTVATKTTNKKPDTKSEPSTSREVKEVPKYTFHDILEDKEVVIPEEELQRPENKVSMQYVMPCAAFGDVKNADALKAKIAFLGFESKIVPIDTSSRRLFRVQLGPFSSKRQAESIRHRLQENDINDCKIWGKKL
ncbi:MAG: SPOR domain-containing protein [Gammaproteobacteria bacterium]|nr:SPOR domain-containing protein [Gammaproteobacteria bacterium]NVK89506.1 SPOR domain-containing protein [Gammaproteobacteria bacterium]